ncbi:hypothetical protein G7046_g10138 [Stylonectria norvegica]|nr:hypothetical protein G7046_g10138 [Stylonectria norvegica]
MLGEWRTMNRLWGVMGMYFAAKDLLHRTTTRAEKADGEAVDKPDRFNTVVEGAQIAALTTYHVLEASVFLSSKKVLTWSPRAQANMSKWCVQAWAAYVAMDVTKMLVERSRKKKSGEEAADAKWKTEWNTNFLRTLAWAPLTVHWSLPGGILPEVVVAFLAAYPSTGLMRDLWRSTA